MNFKTIDHQMFKETLSKKLEEEGVNVNKISKIYLTEGSVIAHIVSTDSDLITNISELF